MERMEPDATPVGIEYGISQQVIDVDDHGRHHDEPARQPLVPECQPGNSAGDGKVKKDVQERHGPGTSVLLRRSIYSLHNSNGKIRWKLGFVYCLLFVIMVLGTSHFMLFTADHDQEHLKSLLGMQGMGNVGRHDQHFPGFDNGGVSTDGDFRQPIQDGDHGVKGCLVLTETLPGIKRKQCDGTGVFLDERLADDRSIGIIDMAFQVEWDAFLGGCIIVHDCLL